MPWSTRTARSEARPSESPYSTTESRWRIDGVRGGEGPPPRSCPKAKLLLHGDRNFEHHETAIGVDHIGVTTVSALALIADLEPGCRAGRNGYAIPGDLHSTRRGRHEDGVQPAERMDQAELSAGGAASGATPEGSGSSPAEALTIRPGGTVFSRSRRSV